MQPLHVNLTSFSPQKKSIWQLIKEKFSKKESLPPYLTKALKKSLKEKHNGPTH